MKIKYVCGETGKEFNTEKEALECENKYRAERLERQIKELIKEQKEQEIQEIADNLGNKIGEFIEKYKNYPDVKIIASKDLYFYYR